MVMHCPRPGCTRRREFKILCDRCLAEVPGDLLQQLDLQRKSGSAAAARKAEQAVLDCLPPLEVELDGRTQQAEGFRSCDACPFAESSQRDHTAIELSDHWCTATRERTWLGLGDRAVCLPIVAEHATTQNEAQT